VVGVLLLLWRQGRGDTGKAGAGPQVKGPIVALTEAGKPRGSWLAENTDCRRGAPKFTVFCQTEGKGGEQPEQRCGPKKWTIREGGGVHNRPKDSTFWAKRKKQGDPNAEQVVLHQWGPVKCRVSWSFPQFC